MKKISIQLMTLCMIAMISYAQETENIEKEAVTLPTLTVTAQKREEVLQKVPITVASIDSTKTEELQIDNINEVGRISPNFKSYGYGNLNHIQASAGVSTSLIEDKLFARISGSSTFRDGYIENTFLETNNLLEHEQYGGNLRLTYLPSSSLSLSLNTSLTQRAVDAYAFVGGFGVTGEDINALLNDSPYQVAYNTQGVYETLVSNNALKVGTDAYDCNAARC